MLNRIVIISQSQKEATIACIQRCLMTNPNRPITSLRQPTSDTMATWQFYFIYVLRPQSTKFLIHFSKVKNYKTLAIVILAILVLISGQRMIAGQLDTETTAHRRGNDINAPRQRRPTKQTLTTFLRELLSFHSN